MNDRITLELDGLKTVSETNCSGGHWRGIHHRRERQKNRVYAEMLAVRSQLPPLPVRVEMVRWSVKTMDDDNLRGALKAVRDAVAMTYGVDDADERIIWKYAQDRLHKRGAHRVTITIERAT